MHSRAENMNPQVSSEQHHKASTMALQSLSPQPETIHPRATKKQKTNKNTELVMKKKTTEMPPPPNLVPGVPLMRLPKVYNCLYIAKFHFDVCSFLIIAWHC